MSEQYIQVPPDSTGRHDKKQQET